MDFACCSYQLIRVYLLINSFCIYGRSSLLAKGLDELIDWDLAARI